MSKVLGKVKVYDRQAGGRGEGRGEVGRGQGRSGRHGSTIHIQPLDCEGVTWGMMRSRNILLNLLGKIGLGDRTVTV